MKQFALLLFLCAALLLAAPAFARTYIYEDALCVSIPNDWETTENVVSKKEVVLSLCGTEPGFMQIDVYVSEGGGTIYDRDVLSAEVEKQYAFAQANVTYMNGTHSGQQVAYWEGQVENGPVYGATIVANNRTYTFLCGAYVDAEHTAMRELTAADFSQLAYIVSSLKTNAYSFTEESAELEYPFEIMTYTDKDGNEILFAMEKKTLNDKSYTLKTQKDDNGLPVMKLYDYKGVLDYITSYDPAQGAWIKTTSDGTFVNKSYFDADGIWTVELSGGSVHTYTPEGIKIVTKYYDDGSLDCRYFYNGNTLLGYDTYENNQLLYSSTYAEDGTKVTDIYDEDGVLAERYTFPLDGSWITEYFNAAGEVIYTNCEVMNSQGNYVALPKSLSEPTAEPAAAKEGALFASFEEAMSAYQELLSDTSKETNETTNVTSICKRYYKTIGNGQYVQVAAETYDENMNLITVYFTEWNDNGDIVSSRTYNGDGTPQSARYEADGTTPATFSKFDENGDWMTKYFDSADNVTHTEITTPPAPLF